jgi:putative copper export protein
MSPYFLHMLAYLFARYLHIVCAAILVGGTLFYEMVVPSAIDELKTEQQLFIFARARWFFKWIVWVCAVVILFSGVVNSYGHWREYNRDESYQIATSNSQLPADESVSPVVRPGWWWAAHSSCGILAIIISVGLTIGKVPPSQPIRWMRLNLIILLLVVFLATATRQTRLESSSPSGSQLSTSEAPEPSPR